MRILGCLVPGRKKRRPSPRRVDIASLKYSSLSLTNTGSATVKVYLNGQGPILTSSGKHTSVELPPYQLTGPLEWEAHVEVSKHTSRRPARPRLNACNWRGSETTSRASSRG